MGNFQMVVKVAVCDACDYWESVPLSLSSFTDH